MPYTRPKLTKRSRRVNPALKKLCVPGCVITKLRRKKNLTAGFLESPYKYVVNSGYNFAGSFTLDIAVGFIDRDRDTMMIDSWYADDIVMEEIWKEDISLFYLFLDIHSLVPQGNPFTFNTPIQTGPNQMQFPFITTHHVATVNNQQPPMQQTNNVSGQAQVFNVNQGQGNMYPTGNEQQQQTELDVIKNLEECTIDPAKNMQQQQQQPASNNQTLEGSGTINQERGDPKPVGGVEESKGKGKSINKPEQPSSDEKSVQGGGEASTQESSPSTSDDKVS
ncbi:hypothetical protein HPULCUR_008099 [Helicostylum pulchrum]|uniref:Uncharacterized protein n=1 Tax=Helicostylum pulchrum TaxID=562976 RepID=A0ABP9Y6N7_9FUNG